MVEEVVVELAALTSNPASLRMHAISPARAVVVLVLVLVAPLPAPPRPQLQTALPVETAKSAPAVFARIPQPKLLMPRPRLHH